MYINVSGEYMGMTMIIAECTRRGAIGGVLPLVSSKLPNGSLNLLRSLPTSQKLKQQWFTV